MYDTDKRKLLSALCHGAIFLSITFVSIAIPVAIMLLNDDPVVKENAKESINFHLNVWCWGLIIGILTSLTFGMLVGLTFIAFPLQWGLTIWALAFVLSDAERPFRYPFIFRLL
jgi:hypothetical protein